jgi:alpha-ketoglutarate-dependent taurine dioxygenase
MGLGCTWVDGSLTTSFRSPGIVEHPDTGESIWFNQLISQSIVAEVVGDELMAAYDEHYRDGRPRPFENRYGDGGEIDVADIREAHRLLDEATVAFPWQAGDVLLLDNYYTGHGRNPFTGTRDIQVALLGEGGA